MPLLRPALGVLVFFLTTSGARAQCTFQWRLVEGDKLKYVIEDKCASKTKVGQESFDLKQNLRLDTIWQVSNVAPSGQIQVVVTVERLQFSANGEGAAAIGRVSFDSKEAVRSDSKPEKSVAAVLDSIVRSKVVVNIDTQGKVTKFEIESKLRAIFEDNATRELAGFFGDLFTADGFRHRLTNWFVEFPEQPVPAGGSWTESKLSRLGRALPCTHSYVHSGRAVRNGSTLEKIEVKPKYELPKDEDSKAKIASQSGEGTIYFDLPNGRIVESIVTQDIVVQSFGESTVQAITTVKLAKAD